MFDGVSGAFVARIMAARNAEAEAEAVDILAPRASDAVLVIGSGPGVGLAILAEKLPTGRCVGVDPSGVMIRQAERRCARYISAGRVKLQQTTAATIDALDASFDGAIAVNSLQLCDPISETAAELARVMKPGARMVSLTHDWAAERHAGSVASWTTQVGNALSAHGFAGVKAGRGQAERGKIVLLTAERQ
ncbi:MAG: class I SAM-dependent methyltransferase [Hyphomonadaceae bacterium]